MFWYSLFFDFITRVIVLLVGWCGWWCLFCLMVWVLDWLGVGSFVGAFCMYICPVITLNVWVYCVCLCGFWFWFWFGVGLFLGLLDG